MHINIASACTSKLKFKLMLVLNPMSWMGNAETLRFAQVLDILYLYTFVVVKIVVPNPC